MNNVNELLIKAVYNSDIDDIKNLLNQKADINFINEQKDSPLLVAISNNDLTVANFLLTNGANPNPDPSSVYTLPLNLAVDISVQEVNYDANQKKEYLDMIKLLLKFGADMNKKDADGESAVELSKDYNLEAEKFFNNLKK